MVLEVVPFDQCILRTGVCVCVFFWDKQETLTVRHLMGSASCRFLTALSSHGDLRPVVHDGHGIGVAPNVQTCNRCSLSSSCCQSSESRQIYPPVVQHSWVILKLNGH